ncbi:MAG: signal peptidase I, partial [Deltaproteobacteria bacterium]|nr:signal peptidase I [Deltaproteobacteria bacterium]
GKLRKGILFFAASLVVPFLLFQLSVVGPDQTMMVLLALSLLADPGLSVWAALDAWKQAKRSGKDYRLKIYNKLPVYILLIAGLYLLVFALMTGWRKLEFLAVPYRQATASMAPTILPGDLILADHRIDHSSENLGLRRGELVVFKLPQDKKLCVVKRIIGLPGDDIELRGMELYVNGIKCTSQETPPPEGREAESDGKKIIAFYEKGDSGAYKVYYSKETTRSDFRISVPEGCCFVLGDNRDISADSRHWGAIALDDIIARPRIVYFSRDPAGGVRWDRIGKRPENIKSKKSRSSLNPMISQ